MPTLIDVRGQSATFPHPPTRILSLAPSLTATLFDLGQGRRLVGCTDYCHLPPAWQHLPRLGGTKNPKRFDILKLAPDVILVNTEENRSIDAAWFERRGLRLFALFPCTPAQAVADARTLARLCGLDADSVVNRRLDDLAAAIHALEQRRAARQQHGQHMRFCVLIWKQPWMTANRHTYISALLELSGAANVFGARERRFPLAFELGLTTQEDATDSRDTRYPRLRLEHLAAAAPDVVLLLTEPYAFSQSNVESLLAEPALAAVPATRQGRVHLVGGAMLTWHNPAWLETALRSLHEGELAAILSPAPSSDHHPPTGLVL